MLGALAHWPGLTRPRLAGFQVSTEAPASLPAHEGTARVRDYGRRTGVGAGGSGTLSQDIPDERGTFNFVAKTNRLRRRFGPFANVQRWADHLLLTGVPFLTRYYTCVVCRFEK